MLELSQVAKVSRVELQQYELYSARVREFEAWGRQSHPRSDGYGSEYARTLNSSQWQLLGNFTGGAVCGSCGSAAPGGGGQGHSTSVSVPLCLSNEVMSLLAFSTSGCSAVKLSSLLHRHLGPFLALECS